MCRVYVAPYLLILSTKKSSFRFMSSRLTSKTSSAHGRTGVSRPATHRRKRQLGFLPRRRYGQRPCIWQPLSNTSASCNEQLSGHTYRTRVAQSVYIVGMLAGSIFIGRTGLALLQCLHVQKCACCHSCIHYFQPCSAPTSAHRKFHSLLAAQAPVNIALHPRWELLGQSPSQAGRCNTDRDFFDGIPASIAFSPDTLL